MPDVQDLVNSFVLKIERRRIEGSQATAKQTAELLRQVVSQQRMPCTNQAAVLSDAVKAVGEQLIAANPSGSAIKPEDQSDNMQQSETKTVDGHSYGMRDTNKI